MNFEEFTVSLQISIPPTGLSIYVQSLWFDTKGDWNTAHELIQDLNDKTAAHIHAYLHRKEGDTFNADYWYRRAGKARPDISSEDERKQLVEELLDTFKSGS
jgi:hypothetical protein